MISKSCSLSPLLSSSKVSWSFCFKSLSLIRAKIHLQLHFCRGYVRLPLTITTIIVPMPAPATCWVPVQSHSVSTLCPQVSTTTKSVSVGCLFQATKVTFSSDSSRKMFFFAVLGRIALGSVTGQLSLYHTDQLWPK